MPLGAQTGLSAVEAADIDTREGRALRSATAVIATSRWTARQLGGRHRLPHVSVALPGVDRAEVVVGSDPPLITHVAALLPHKDQRGLVAALAEVADLPWRARLVGSLARDPAYAAKVRALIDSLGLADRVELAGELSRAKAWAGADLAVLPSLVESYGLVVTEALARGVPAVVGAGGPEEALGQSPDGGLPGMVVPPGDQAALVDALRAWLSDPALRESLRSRALARRATLEGWETTARSVREALSGVG